MVVVGPPPIRPARAVEVGRGHRAKAVGTPGPHESTAGPGRESLPHGLGGEHGGCSCPALSHRSASARRMERPVVEGDTVEYMPAAKAVKHLSAPVAVGRGPSGYEPRAS